MNPNTKSVLLTIGAVFGSILAAWSAHGKAAVDALAGVPAMLGAWATALPLGVGSFALAIVVGTLLWTVLDRKRAPMECGKPRSFSNDTLTGCAAMLVVLSQQWAAGAGGRGALLHALWLGLVAGLLAPYLGRGARALFSKKVAS